MLIMQRIANNKGVLMEKDGKRIMASTPPCMTENHQVYIAGRGYVKVKDLQPDDVIINEVNGSTHRVKVLTTYFK